MLNRIRRWWFMFTDPHYIFRLDQGPNLPFGYQMMWTCNNNRNQYEYLISLGNGYFYVKTEPYEQTDPKQSER